MRKILLENAVKLKGYRVFKIVDEKGRQLKIVTTKNGNCKFPLFYDVTNARFVENKHLIGGPSFVNRLDVECVYRFFKAFWKNTSNVIEITDEYKTKKKGDRHEKTRSSQ